MAMADRIDRLDRLCTALARPGVTGVLATADILEDLLLLGVLDGKTVFGSMNRSGLAGASFELDDRFTGYETATVAAMGFDCGKMLLRMDYADDRTVSTLASGARAINELADAGLVAMVEPFISRRVDGVVTNDLSPDAVTKSIAIASGLGRTSAYTWLKAINKPWVNYLYCAPHTFHLSGDDPGADIGAMLDYAASKLAHVHVADSFNHKGSSGLRYILNPPGTPARVHQHLDIGQGEVNWDEFFGNLGTLGFDGVMTVCVFGWEERARESALFMREEIERRIKDWPFDLAREMR